MTTRKLNGPLGGDYVTDGRGNAVLAFDDPITDDNRLGGRLTIAEAKVRGITPPAGLKWAFMGDSIFNGSTAGNIEYAVMMQAIAMAGGLVARRDSIESGVAGNKASDLLARVDTLLAASPEAVVIMIGTNDSGESVSLTDFSATMLALVNTIRAAGIPVMVATPPPAASAQPSARHALIQSYVLWEKLVLPTIGVPVVDVYTALADASGNLASAYDAGDTVHPNATGHNKMAVVIARGMRALVGAKLWPFTAPNTINSIADVRNARTAPTTSPWFEQPGGTGTAPTYTMENDASGMLAAGRWAQMAVNAASGGTRRLSTPQITVSAGQVWLLAAQMQVEDVGGGWEAAVIAGTASWVPQPVNQSGAGIAASPPFYRCPGLPNLTVANTYDFAPIWVLTIPSGVTAMSLWFTLVLPTGLNVKARVGAYAAINLSANGMAAIFPWDNSFVSVPA